MAEQSYLWATTGTGDGSAAGYGSAALFEIFRSLLAGARGANLGGVGPDYRNKLAGARAWGRGWGRRRSRWQTPPGPMR